MNMNYQYPPSAPPFNQNIVNDKLPVCYPKLEENITDSNTKQIQLQTIPPINLNININKKEKNTNEQKGLKRHQKIRNKANINDFDDCDKEEIFDFGMYLGVNLFKYPSCLNIVLEAINSPLPENWTEEHTINGGVYYFNSNLRYSSWEHPTDSCYRDAIKAEKKKIKKNRSQCTIM